MRFFAYIFLFIFTTGNVLSAVNQDCGGKIDAHRERSGIIRYSTPADFNLDDVYNGFTGDNREKLSDFVCTWTIDGTLTQTIRLEVVSSDENSHLRVKFEGDEYSKTHKKGERRLYIGRGKTTVEWSVGKYTKSLHTLHLRWYASEDSLALGSHTPYTNYGANTASPYRSEIPKPLKLFSVLDIPTRLGGGVSGISDKEGPPLPQEETHNGAETAGVLNSNLALTGTHTYAYANQALSGTYTKTVTETFITTSTIVTSNPAPPHPVSQGQLPHSNLRSAETPITVVTSLINSDTNTQAIGITYTDPELYMEIKSKSESFSVGSVLPASDIHTHSQLMEHTHRKPLQTLPAGQGSSSVTYRGEVTIPTTPEQTVNRGVSTGKADTSKNVLAITSGNKAAESDRSNRLPRSPYPDPEIHNPSHTLVYNLSDTSGHMQASVSPSTDFTNQTWESSANSDNTNHSRVSDSPRMSEEKIPIPSSSSPLSLTDPTDILDLGSSSKTEHTFLNGHTPPEVYNTNTYTSANTNITTSAHTSHTLQSHVTANEDVSHTNVASQTTQTTRPIYTEQTHLPSMDEALNHSESSDPVYANTIYSTVSPNTLTPLLESTPSVLPHTGGSVIPDWGKNSSQYGRDSVDSTTEPNLEKEESSNVTALPPVYFTSPQTVTLSTQTPDQSPDAITAATALTQVNDWTERGTDNLPLFSNTSAETNTHIQRSRETSTNKQNPELNAEASTAFISSTPPSGTVSEHTHNDMMTPEPTLSGEGSVSVTPTMHLGETSSANILTGLSKTTDNHPDRRTVPVTSFPSTATPSGPVVILSSTVTPTTGAVSTRNPINVSQSPPTVTSQAGPTRTQQHHPRPTTHPAKNTAGSHTLPPQISTVSRPLHPKTQTPSPQPITPSSQMYPSPSVSAGDSFPKGGVFVVEDQPAIIKEKTFKLLLQVTVDRAFSPGAGLLELEPFLQRVAGYQGQQVTWKRGPVLQALVEFRTEQALSWLGKADSLLQEAGLIRALTDGLHVDGTQVKNITVGGLQADVCSWLFSCPSGFQCMPAEGNASCRSLCLSDYCKNQGICVHRRGQQPLCQCPVGEDFWYMGPRCDFRMTRQRLVGVCFGVLFAVAVLMALLSYLAVRRFKSMLIQAKVDQTQSSYRRFNHFDELSGRFWGRSRPGSEDSLDNPGFSRSDELLHLRALDRTCCYHDDTLSIVSTYQGSVTQLNTIYPHSSQYGWDLSNYSLTDGVVDSGKASDLSVCSWPIEPIQWTPFPLLQQLRTHSTAKGHRPRSYCEGMELVDLEKSWTA
ncbi:mucin-17 [Chanos chanos]|uniref:Mucin-17 n=1 Tax=Chanos chanos TaxID=29144 RepID=A0A6J2VUM6_CHACN|nr:mucin-17-like [Chanos chanos]